MLEIHVVEMQRFADSRFGMQRVLKSLGCVAETGLS